MLIASYFSGICSESQFDKQILNETLNVPHVKQLPSSSKEAPHFFVGDAAFPLKTHLMRPYPDNGYVNKKKFSIIDCRERAELLKILSEFW